MRDSYLRFAPVVAKRSSTRRAATRLSHGQISSSYRMSFFYLQAAVGPLTRGAGFVSPLRSGRRRAEVLRSTSVVAERSSPGRAATHKARNVSCGAGFLRAKAKSPKYIGKQHDLGLFHFLPLHLGAVNATSCLEISGTWGFCGIRRCDV